MIRLVRRLLSYLLFRRRNRNRTGRDSPRAADPSHFSTLLALVLLVVLSACRSAEEAGPVENDPGESSAPLRETEPVETPVPETEPQGATPVTRPRSPADSSYPAPDDQEQPLAATIPVELQATPTTAGGDAGYPPPEYPVQQVSIPAADGLVLTGTLYSPTSGSGPWPGVLLLHMLGSERGAWADPAAELAAAGYVALAVDMRGHGETGGTNDWDLAAEDLELAWAYLASRPEVDQERTAVIGASIGANMALVTGAAEPAVQAVGLLSPGLDYQGVTTLDALADYGHRPLLIVASEGDTTAASASQTLSELAPAGAELEIYPGNAHGTNIFAAQPALIDLITAWLAETLS